MAAILKRNIVQCRYVEFEPDQPDYFKEQFSKAEFLNGMRMNEIPYDHITSATQVKRTDGKIPDIITVRTIRICSRRFKDFVESFETGLHFFQPFVIKRFGGEPIGEYYKYGVGQDIDCLFTRSISKNFETYTGSEGEVKTFFYASNAISEARYREQHPDKSDAPLIEISGPAVEGAHLWTMGLLGGGGCDEPMVMSDKMYKAFKKEKFSELDYCCHAHEIDRPWIAEEEMGAMLPRWRQRQQNIALHWSEPEKRRGKI